MTSKGESLRSNRPDNKHMNVWELYILDSVDWNIEAKPSLLLWETISIMNEILAMAFEFWQPDISDDIHLFKEGTCTFTKNSCILLHNLKKSLQICLKLPPKCETHFLYRSLFIIIY